jgi:hypothetical protein
MTASDGYRCRGCDKLHPIALTPIERACPECGAVGLFCTAEGQCWDCLLDEREPKESDEVDEHGLARTDTDGVTR